MLKPAPRKRSGIIKNMTIRAKLLLSYFALIFIPLGILTLIAYFNVSAVLEAQIRRSTSQSFDQAYTFLSYSLKTLIDASDVVYANADVQAILTRSRDEFENDIVQQNIDMMKLDGFLNSFKNNEDIYRVSLHVPGWLSYANQDINFINMDDYMKTGEYNELLRSSAKVTWLPPEFVKNDIGYMDPISVISMIRKIRNINQIDQFIGVIKVSILESNIQNIIGKASTTRDGVVYIQNSKGDIICNSNDDNLARLGLGRSGGGNIEGGDLLWEIKSIGGNRLAITSRSVDHTDWTMISAIPYSEILAESDKIRNLMFILMFVIGLIAYGLATIISSSAVKRINLLMKNMEIVQNGELDVNIASKNNDEIGRLIDSFNYMVKRISILIEQQYKAGQQIKNAELKALQAQINPHFLYNTLDLINWKAIDNDVPEIALLAQSLAKFYKLSLNKGKDIVTIGEEIEHVKNYVGIQNMRFDNRIRLIVNVDSGFYEYRILKIILQPLVENSIIHGILENRSKQDGAITLSCRLENDDIVLSLQDDGIGMPEEKAAEILATDGDSDTHGYGVTNIHHRIKLYYGQQYGLSYKSAPGRGTLVQIRIPAIRQ